MIHSRLCAAGLGAAVMACLAGCSAGSDGGPGGSGAGNDVGAGSGTALGSGGFISVGPGAGGIGIITVGTGGAGTGTGGSGEGSCGVVQKPEQIIQYSPIALYIMLDRSGSMVTGFPEGSAESWQNSTNAINAFATDPSSQNIDMGLAFFPTAPDNGWTCGDGTGSGANCGAPVVEIGPVAQTGPQLANAMNSNVPFPLSLTPTECGLIGMINHCQDWQRQTGEQCVAILVTDGNPTLCNGDVNALAKIVADGKTNGVTTFVIGLPGSNANVLDPLAQAGGSGASIDVSGGVGVFIAALNTIRGSVSIGTALPCQWKIPPPPAGLQFDPLMVNVQFTPQGGQPQDFGYVVQADCARASNAWYFDDVNSPTQVLACPSTCETLEASVGAEVFVSFGCARAPAIIR